MGLPRGRRWVDMPRKANPTLAEKYAAAWQAGMESTEPLQDPLAFREQMHREAESSSRRQGELPLLGGCRSDRRR